MANLIRYLQYLYKFGFFLFITKKKFLIKKILQPTIFCKLMVYRHKCIERKIRKLTKNYKQEKLDDPSTSFPNTIWFCWLQGTNNMPEIVSLCFERIKQICTDYNVRFISIDTYQKYINLPVYIKEIYYRRGIKNAHFADILRTYLLYRYGGWWLDSTIYLSQQLPDTSQLNFYSCRLKVDNMYVSQCRWCNFLFYTKSNDPVMANTLRLFYSYLKMEPTFIDYFLMDYFIDIAYQDSPLVRKEIDSIPKYKGNIYKLVTILNDKYDKGKLDSLLKENIFNKLIWDKVYYKKINGEMTNWGLLTNLK